MPGVFSYLRTESGIRHPASGAQRYGDIRRSIRNADLVTRLALRDASDDDLDDCVRLWVDACERREGVAHSGVDGRARVQFADRIVWLVADGPAGVQGFVLATPPGTGRPSDPPGAAMVSLLGVSPDAQGTGLGRALLREVTARLAALGYEQAALHVLTDNTPAVRLYESEGWRPHGAPFMNELPRRESLSYTRRLGREP